LAQGQFGEDGNKRQLGSGSPTSKASKARRLRVPGTPMEDPDVDAFLQQAARIVLRVKGLAGHPPAQAAKEEDRDTA